MTTEQRTCGTCQACCLVLSVYFDNDLSKPPESPAYEKCQHQCEKGCGIYETKPSPCAAYSCLWLLGWADDGDRPDRLGLVLEAHREPNIVTANEVRAGAWQDERAKIRLVQLNEQIPVAVSPFGGGAGMLVDVPRQTKDQMREYGLLPMAKGAG